MAKNKEDRRKLHSIKNTKERIKKMSWAKDSKWDNPDTYDEDGYIKKEHIQKHREKTGQKDVVNLFPHDARKEIKGMEEYVVKKASQMKEYNVPSTMGETKRKAKYKRMQKRRRAVKHGKFDKISVGEAFGTSPHTSDETGKSRKERHDEAVRDKRKKKKTKFDKKRKGGSISYSSGQSSSQAAKGYSKNYPGMGD